MQDSIRKTFIILLLLILFSSCSAKNDSFTDAINKHRENTISKVSKVKKGLPFFTSNTLTPTWEVVKGSHRVKIPNFKLINQNNHQVTQKIFEDKISIVSFLFTSCTGFCPLLVKKMKDIEEKIKYKKNIQLVFFSVDPEVDTPKKLTEFAKSHNIFSKKNWTLITGKRDLRQ